MNLFELLHQSHAVQRRLCSRLMSARSSPRQRTAAFLQLKVELQAHAAAEERHLYVPLLMKAGGCGLIRSGHAACHRRVLGRVQGRVLGRSLAPPHGRRMGGAGEARFFEAFGRACACLGRVFEAGMPPCRVLRTLRTRRPAEI